MKENLYVYMRINAKFNCIYCFIYMFNLISECILVDGVFCSAIRTI
jgi:hypothetical protein